MKISCTNCNKELGEGDHLFDHAIPRLKNGFEPEIN